MEAYEALRNKESMTFRLRNNEDMEWSDTISPLVRKRFRRQAAKKPHSHDGGRKKRKRFTRKY